jgi:hypothetical protein
MSNRWNRDDVHGITTLVCSDQYDPSEEVPPFLVEGIIHRSITLIYGTPEGGKSTLARTVSAGLANGIGDILGKPITTDPMKVAVIAADPDSALEYAYEFKDLLGPGIQIPIHCPDLPVASSTWDEMHSLAARGEYQVIVVDNLWQFLPGGDLDDPAAIQSFYHKLRWFDNHQIAVILIAHSSVKTRSKSALGHTTIHAGPRWECHVEGRSPERTRKLTFRGNPREGKAWSVLSTMDGPKVVACNDATEDELAAHRGSKAKRATKREAVKAFVQQNRGKMPNAELARQMAATFHGKQSSYESGLSRGLYR